MATKTDPNVRQLTMAIALENLEFELLQLAREATLDRYSVKRDGPRSKSGKPRRGMKFGICAHPNCGGCRRVWPYKGLFICSRDWRVRRRIWQLLKGVKERGFVM